VTAELSRDDVAAVAAWLADHVIRTPVVRSAELDAIAGSRIWLKAENLQTTGCYKIRGALRAVDRIAREGVARGIITQSTGNHAIAVAVAAPAPTGRHAAPGRHRHWLLRHRPGPVGTGFTSLTRRTCWVDREQDLPVIEGTLIGLQVEHLPGDSDPKLCGCDAPQWTPAPLTSTAGGSRSYAGSTTFRPAVQTDPEAGSDQNCALRRRRNAEPGRSSSRTPKSGWSGLWRGPTPSLGTTSHTSLAHARDRRAFRTSAQPQPRQPVHRNLPNPARDGQPAHGTDDPRPATTSANHQTRLDHHRP
jgi:hypothetical protein